MDILESDRELLMHLLENLRTEEDARVIELVNYIRSFASFDEAKEFLESHFRRQKGIYADPSSMSFSQIQLPTVLDAQQTKERPMVRVPAKPWTTVTKDDAFVSHLISLWLTWHLPWFHCIDQDLFISAMQSGNVQSSLCSPFLVNAILAAACVSLLGYLIPLASPIFS